MISSLETLAQIALIVVTQHIRIGMRTNVTLPLNTDNTPTEGAVNKLYSGKEPLKFYIQLLAWWCLRLRVVPVARHLPGSSNTWADLISRNDQNFLKLLDPSRRLNIMLSDIIAPFLSATGGK